MKGSHFNSLLYMIKVMMVIRFQFIRTFYTIYARYCFYFNTKLRFITLISIIQFSIKSKILFQQKIKPKSKF